MKETFSFQVKRLPQQTFEALTDLERFAQASQGKASIAAVPDRPRAGKGSAVLIKTAAEGGVGDVLCETLEWEPPRRCVRRFAIKDLPTTIGIDCREKDDGTQVTVDLELEPQSLMYKMMLPVLASRFRAEKDKVLAQLQQQLA